MGQDGVAIPTDPQHPTVADIQDLTISRINDVLIMLVFYNAGF